jgi:hypothetical protein
MSTFDAGHDPDREMDEAAKNRLKRRRRFLKIGAGLALGAVPVGMGVKGIEWFLDSLDRAH